MRCGVANCNYVSSSDLDGFPVCELHDAAQTKGILDELRLPGSFWCGGHPIVLPCGELEEEHFFQEGGEPLDPEKLNINWNGPGASPRFDLCKEYEEAN